jgi:bacteriorhodopsin
MSTFHTTFFFLVFACITTFLVSLLRTKTKSNILLIESVITGVASFVYYKMINYLNDTNTSNIQQNTILSNITQLRYTDWSITTPLMLISFCLFLSFNSNTKVKINTFAYIILLDYLMLLIGYLGENGFCSQTTASISGFIPLLLLFYIIYNNYVSPKYNFTNLVVFLTYLILWSIYGIVYNYNQINKNIMFNILDCISKAFMGIFYTVYFTL